MNQKPMFTPYSQWAPSQLDTKGLNLADRQDWLVPNIGQNRDSGCLTTHNFAEFEKRLAEVDSKGVAHEVHRFGHWACGWFEIILVQPNSAAHKAAQEMLEALEEYPILRESFHDACGECEECAP